MRVRTDSCSEPKEHCANESTNLSTGLSFSIGMRLSIRVALNMSVVLSVRMASTIRGEPGTLFSAVLCGRY